MSDDELLLGRLTAKERAIWEQIKRERAAGADAERLKELGRDARETRDQKNDLAGRVLHCQ